MKVAYASENINIVLHIFDEEQVVIPITALFECLSFLLFFKLSFFAVEKHVEQIPDHFDKIKGIFAGIFLHLVIVSLYNSLCSLSDFLKPKLEN